MLCDLCTIDRYLKLWRAAEDLLYDNINSKSFKIIERNKIILIMSSFLKRIWKKKNEEERHGEQRRKVGREKEEAEDS